jgi:uncharacterized protein YndB with AHSA1/START domain
MATASERPTSAQPGPLLTQRVFPYSRDLVFRAWSSAEHLRRWFCPQNYTIPSADIDFRVGGAFTLCMRSPEGLEHWTRGRYVEIEHNARLVIDMTVFADHDQQLFRAQTLVRFAEGAGGGTRLEVTQHYTPYQASAAPMLQGAAEGWRQTLDRLELELARIRAAVPGRSVVHGSFVIERTYPASRAQVFRALTEPEAKARWFGCGEAFTVLARHMDVRCGGRERLQGRWQSGMVTTFEAIYHDVVPDERLIYSYEMQLDDRRISVSLATIELQPAAAGTRLVMSEHGAFLDGYDDSGSRQRGTHGLLDGLGRALSGLTG